MKTPRSGSSRLHKRLVRERRADASSLRLTGRPHTRIPKLRQLSPSTVRRVYVLQYFATKEGCNRQFLKLIDLLSTQRLLPEFGKFIRQKRIARPLINLLKFAGPNAVVRLLSEFGANDTIHFLFWTSDYAASTGRSLSGTDRLPIAIQQAGIEQVIGDLKTASSVVVRQINNGTYLDELARYRRNRKKNRMGVALNKECHLVKDIEMEMVERKVLAEQAEMKKKGIKYLSEEEALAKYK